eukprot:scaffold2366_cov159-Amphora_coffeaeformis.AAC.3
MMRERQYRRSVQNQPVPLTKTYASHCSKSSIGLRTPSRSLNFTPGVATITYATRSLCRMTLPGSDSAIRRAKTA